ncbi:MAG: bifunctional folylpolyglutamate synthase/dihydrofolate synthase [Alphaproteobacteria bacterium]|nr:bifunctional folylpolyglutamate synthase/dihydrofolate synthase [Alphaproteobacteria bacterium]
MSEMDALLDRLFNALPKKIDLSLDRLPRLLAALGNPERKLPPVVHVAGTNGKGSLIAYLRAIVEAAGYKAHVYTSPHLVRFHERIVVAGEEIGDAYLVNCLKRVLGCWGESEASFFESTTAAAFLAFAETPADVVLLETGMGGRLDATNVIEKPLLTAITPVALDHQEFLGDTLAAIAGEKAGILKTNVTCVVGPQEEEALRALKQKAAEKNAMLFIHGEDWRLENGHYRSALWDFVLPQPALAGGHQLRNAATAVACVEKMQGFVISEEAIRQGIGAARWRARLQRLESAALLHLLPKGSEVFLDGGHNPQGGAAVAAHFAGRRIQLVCGMLEGKDAEGFLRCFAEITERFYAVLVPDPKGKAPALLAETARRAGIGETRQAGSVAEAFKEMGERAEGPVTVLIAGSLYLAGAVLAEFGG